MKSVSAVAALLCLFVIQLFSAQTIIKKSDTINGTPLNEQLDSRVNDLMNNAACKTSRRVAANTNITRTDEPEYTPAPTRTKTVNRPPTTAEICRQHPRMAGYKILVTVVNSLEESNKIAAQVRQRFPDLRVERDGSLRPNYKVLAGSYFSKESGHADLRRVKSAFSTAVLVPYRIFCVEGK